MNRKNFIGLSFASLLALLSEKILGKEIKAMGKEIQIKNYLICKGIDEIHYFDLSPYYANWYAVVSDSLPTGIDALQDSYTGSVVGFSVDYSALANGENEVLIEGFKDTEDGESIGEFSLIFDKSECATEIQTCCSEDTINIVWLGREGAIKLWYFSGVREYDVKVGDAGTFKNNDYQLQYSSRNNIYKGRSASTGNISKTEADYLDELRYAIQAWSVIDGEVKPILVDNDSFFKYKSKDKLFDIKVRYIIAEQVLIQTQ